MKILMLTPYAPFSPHSSGGRIRMWEEIQYLGRRHDLTVVSFVSSQEEYELREALASHCNRVIAVMRPNKPSPPKQQDQRRLPWPIGRYVTTEMQKTLETIQEVNFDLVLFEHIFMAEYRDLFSTCTVLEEHNIESNILKQLARIRPSSMEISEERISEQKERALLHATWMHVAKYEDQTWPKFPLRITVSENDKQELDRRCPTGRTIVIENGINTQSIMPVANNGSQKILFMGSMDYMPNVDAVFYLREHILPRIWQRDPTISLVIAGRKPPQTVRNLASNPRIEVFANPEDMSEIAKDCCLTIVPLRIGGGTRIKIPHSMAMGLPVVSTSLGSEGLSVVDGLHILIRDEPEQFANAVLQIISDPALRNNLRTNGRRLVEERYDWSRMFERLEMEILSLVDSSK
jgi:glycosyltransferase involved in cell wall biosynthesis